MDIDLLPDLKLVRRTVRIPHQTNMSMSPLEVSQRNRALSRQGRRDQASMGGAMRPAERRAMHQDDLWTSLPYQDLVKSLAALTDQGVFDDGGLDTALAVARLVDRGRITRSGLSAGDLTQALAEYRKTAVRPVQAIERALEQAIAIAPTVLVEA
jgi:hypothetical protein